MGVWSSRGLLFFYMVRTLTLDCLEEEAFRPTEECWQGMFDSIGTRGSLSSIEIMTEVKGPKRMLQRNLRKRVTGENGQARVNLRLDFSAWQ